jgi:hypothetical protein
MSQTLLDVVQGILSKIDSDAVNDIGDTVESDQIADIVKQTYYDIIDEYELPGQRVLGTLEGLGDIERPNLLQIPEDTQALLNWQYDARLNDQDPLRYIPMEYRLPVDFLKTVNQRNSLDTVTYKVVQVNPDVKIIVDITAAPRYWTSFDDRIIVTDNVDLTIDTTLQASKTQAWMEKRWVFHKESDFVINLPQNLESLLYRTAENEAYAVYKQSVNPKLEQKERRLRIRAQRNKHRTQQYQNNTMNGGPNYGRS